MLLKRPRSRPNKSRRRLLQAGAAALTSLSLPKMVHAQSIEPRHQEHSYWDELLAHIGQSRPRGDSWLRSWLGGLMHEPEARLRGLVLHGPEGSGKQSFTMALGALLVNDGFLVTHERALLEYAYLGARLIAWEGYVLGQVASKATVEKALLRQTTKPVDMIRCETLGGFMVPNTAHANRLHWIETHEDNPRRSGECFETFSVERLRKRLPWSDLKRYLEDEKEAFVAHLSDRHTRYPSMHLRAA